jgi:hypothetical protein
VTRGDQTDDEGAGRVKASAFRSPFRVVDMTVIRCKERLVADRGLLIRCRVIAPFCRPMRAA